MKKRNLPSRRQNQRRFTGFALGSAISIAAVTSLLLPENNWMLSAGPMNSGHEDLKCAECHQDAPGTIRQQLQANAKYLIGMRKNSADIKTLPVLNNDCIACHRRPKDNHPVFRFFEPRFKKARQKLQPQYCNSCHKEHTGKRVTMDPENCVVCHEKLSLKKDTLNVSHKKIIKHKRWDTCMRCHDFHGNHKMKTKTKTLQMYPQETITAYFDGADSPYSSKKIYKAKESRFNDAQ